MTFILFLKFPILANESDILSLIWFEFYLLSEKICKNIIYVNKKLIKSFKVNFGMQLSNNIEFHDFLILIKLIFEFQIILKNNKFYVLNIVWFVI